MQYKTTTWKFYERIYVLCRELLLTNYGSSWYKLFYIALRNNALAKMPQSDKSFLESYNKLQVVHKRNIKYKVGNVHLCILKYVRQLTKVIYSWHELVMLFMCINILSSTCQKHVYHSYCSNNSHAKASTIVAFHIAKNPKFISMTW